MGHHRFTIREPLFLTVTSENGNGIVGIAQFDTWAEAMDCALSMGLRVPEIQSRAECIIDGEVFKSLEAWLELINGDYVPLSHMSWG